MCKKKKKKKKKKEEEERKETPERVTHGDLFIYHSVHCNDLIVILLPRNSFKREALNKTL